ncbi:putative glycoside hydrolase, partial [Candidatus Parcubacteria bacterium]|nr:putative glycoside hydrolase [Candidatus Parcubacteria bacterium]
ERDMKVKKESLTWIGAGLFFVSGAFVALPYVLQSSYKSPSATATLASIEFPTSTPVFVAVHIAPPVGLKAIYMTACVAATPSWREHLKDMIKESELNAVVVDIKDYTGTISFVDKDLQPESPGGCRVKDMQEFVDELHQDNIYVIGRITVFQDPFYAKTHPDLAVKSKASAGVWKDHKGLAFIDVGAKPYWDYVISLAQTSYELGFDEINFDYIRYPSDGNMKDTDYTWTVGTSTKAEMVKSFFEYLHDNLKDTGVKTSADLFGLVTVAQDDLGIGQVLENALPNFDYVDPMVYPSHFAPGTNGYRNPADNPYEIIKYSMAGGVAKEEALNIKLGIATSTPSKLRPWIQDFDLGATYDAAKVRAQIQATYDVGLTSWLSWDASNKYTPEAYLKEE